MSRTDKDRPYRIKVRDNTYHREERHDHRPLYRKCITGEYEAEHLASVWNGEGRLTRYVRAYKAQTYYLHPCDVECDINEPDDRRYRWGRNRCHYDLPYFEARYHTAPPSWYTHHVYHNVERVRTRDLLREAVKEWNGSGDTDVEVDERQARHSARWLWW